ncbi:MAG: radical SAM protein, partial [Syntrophales bacterium]
EGTLPGDKERIIGVIDRFFNLSMEERMIFRLGRRMGIYRCLDDLADSPTYRRLGEILEGYRGKDPRHLEGDLAKIRTRYI